MSVTLYCWRCKEDVIALTEEETARLQPLYEEALRQVRGSIPMDAPMSQLGFLERIGLAPAFQKFRDEFKKLTGRNIGSKCLRVYHTVSDFGPPCPLCKKPLRSAKAAQCFLCGWKGSAPS